MLKVVDLFAGIGAVHRTLLNLKIPFKIVFFSEIEKHAITAYRALWGDGLLNLGDIRKITSDQLQKFKNVDLIVYGSPCVDFSSLKSSKIGGIKGSGTKSSLIFEAARIIKMLKPKIAIGENVASLITHKQHQPVYRQFKKDLSTAGYKTTHQIVNPRFHCGIPQNRPRVFFISRKDYFVEQKYQIKKCPNLKEFLNVNFGQRKQTNLTPILNKKPYAVYLRKNGKVHFTNRAFFISSVCGTITKTDRLALTNGKKISFLESSEAFKLMGFDNQDFLKIKRCGFKDYVLLNLIGNSICVPVLELVIKRAFNLMPPFCKQISLFRDTN